MKIVQYKVKDVKPAKYNPRKISDSAFEGLKESLKKFGLVDPLIVNTRTGVLVGGHQRLKAAEAVGMKTVPVVEIDLSPAEEKALNITLNNQAISGDYSEGIAELLEEIQSEFGDDYMSQLNLDSQSLVQALEQTVSEKKDGKTDDDAVPDIPENSNPYNVKRGQVWKLGKHRLMCGDSTKHDDFDKLMNGCCADITFTSPPYNAGSLNIKDNQTTQNKYNNYDDNKNENDYLTFLSDNLVCCTSFSKTVFYNIGLVEKNKRVIIDIQHIFKDKFKDIIYWKKSSVAPHIQPGIVNNLVEFILCFGDGRRKFMDAQFKQGTYWNVIEGLNASRNEFSKIHKATFPLYLPENIITNFSNNDGSVIDCFMGTGTTLIACEKTGRKCYGMELDEHYCSVIIKRWEDFTEEKAELIS